MIVLLSPDAPPSLTDVTRLDRLHAECRGSLGAACFGDLCAPADDGVHIWLDITAARTAGVALVDDDERADFTSRFDEMVAYAASKGWVNDAGTHLSAHVQQTAQTAQTAQTVQEAGAS